MCCKCNLFFLVIRSISLEAIFIIPWHNVSLCFSLQIVISITSPSSLTMFIKQLIAKLSPKFYRKQTPFLMPPYSVIFKSWVSPHYFFFEFSLTPLHRLLILPLRPWMWNLQSNSQPGNKMSAFKYFIDVRTSHPRHLDRVSSSLKCISPKMFFTSKGIGMSSSLCLEFSFATHTYVKKNGLCCEIWHMNIDHSRNSA